MDNNPPAEPNNTAETPQPETLKPRGESDPLTSATAAPPASDSAQDGVKKARRRVYRPSHRATFISLAVVIAILAVNAVVLAFVLRKQAKIDDQASGQVTINQSALDKLGVNRSSVGDSGVVLTIGPNTQFKNNIAIGGNSDVSGQLGVNGKITASDASLTQLKAGNTSVSKLDVNGDVTSNSVNLRNDLLVTGATRLQGAVTISKLLTVYNNLNVSGNLTIGGVFSARSLASTSTLTVGGHIVTSGSAPSISAGGALGNNGTVSISGTDAAGTVSVNIGTGSASGTIANINFHTDYTATPNVIITPVGRSGSFYVNRNTTGFSIHTSSPLAIGGFAFDYIVMQ